MRLARSCVERINTEVIRGEGTWCFVDFDDMRGGTPLAVTVAAAELGVELAHCGRGAKQRTLAAARLVDAHLARGDGHA